MASSAETHIGNADPESEGEFHDKPLYEKQDSRGAFIDSAMKQYNETVKGSNPRPLSKEISKEEALHLAREQLDKFKRGEVKSVVGGSRVYRETFGGTSQEGNQEETTKPEIESVNLDLESKEDPIINQGAVNPVSESMGELLSSSQLDQNAENINKLKKDGIEFGRINGVAVDLSGYDPSKSTEEYDLKGEIDGALQDLEESELGILRDSNFNIVTKGEEVMYPVYMDDSNTLNVGFLNTGEDILSAIRNIVIPTLKPEILEETVDLNQGQSVGSQVQDTTLGIEEEKVESPQQNMETWKTGEEWNKFERIRAELVKAEVSAKMEKRELTDLERALQRQYIDYKEILSIKIRGGIRQEMGEPTNDNIDEYKAKFEKASKAKIFEELVVGENAVYTKALKEARGATNMDKVKEGLREILGTKAIQWYLGQSRAKRAVINTGLFAVAIGLGTYIGGAAATSALGAGAYRLVRGAASFGGSTLGMKIGNNTWKVEDINKWKEAEEEKIKNSDESVEVKSRKLKDVNEEFGKRMKSVAMNKAVTTVAFGAGAGIGVGLLDWAYSGSGAGSVAENLGKPKVSQPEIQGGVVKEVTRIESPTANLPEGMEPVQNIPKGGSLWGAMKGALQENDRFKALNDGQRNNFVAYYANKMGGDPKSYGFEPDSKYVVRLEANKPIDLSKLFADKGEFEKVMKRAENLPPKVSEQMEKKTIALENFYKANPGRVLTDKEILNIEEMPQVKTAQELVSIEKPKISGMEEEFFGAKNPTELVAENDVDSSSYNDPTDLHNEIKAARERLAELENATPTENPAKVVQMPSKQVGVRDPSFMRSMQGDTRSLAERVNNMGSPNAVIDPVQKAFADEVQGVYGSEGFMGIGKVSGLASKEWGLMKGLNAGEVVKYFTDNSENTTLPPRVVTELAKSSKHQAFSEQLRGLIGVTEGKVKPFENETVEVYLKRLGEFVMKKHTEGAANINMKMAA